MNTQSLTTKNYSMNRENLFNFDYSEVALLNQDGTTSNFQAVYGQNGKLMHTKKISYTLVPTLEFSQLGHSFINKGLDVSTFVHRYGEIIGLNVAFTQRPTELGDIKYNAMIYLPNNGSGKGYFKIQELRLACTNGMVLQNFNYQNNNIKIPHTYDYKYYLEMVENSIIIFDSIIDKNLEKQVAFSKETISKNEFLKFVYAWFYNNEITPTQKKEHFEHLEDFMRVVFSDSSDEILGSRIAGLEESIKFELHLNDILNLKLSKYTAYAVITNYLSRRREFSDSRACEEVKVLRQETKVDNLFALMN